MLTVLGATLEQSDLLNDNVLEISFFHNCAGSFRFSGKIESRFPVFECNQWYAPCKPSVFTLISISYRLIQHRCNSICVGLRRDLPNFNKHLNLWNVALLHKTRKPTKQVQYTLWYLNINPFRLTKTIAEISLSQIIGIF